MVTLLAKFFIGKDEPKETLRTKYGMLCGLVGIVLNLFLFAFKLFAGIMSGAVSIMADAINNLSDAGSSIVTLLGLRLAGQKPDREHPYGHGRLEYISGFLVSVIIIVMGFELMRESAQKILHPQEMAYSSVYVIILAASIGVKAYMAFYNTRVGKRIHSAPLKATAYDSLSDCLTTSVVLGCALLFHFTGLNLDGWCGLLVSLVIFYAGYRAAKEALEPLLGNPPDQDYIDKLEEIVLHFNPNIVGYHDLMVHDYGPGRRFLSLHAEVPADGNLLALHDIIDELEHKLDRELGCIATIHMDPIVTDDPQVLDLKNKVAELAEELYDGISIHDFRMVQKEKAIRLIFDMAVPFECKYGDEDLKKLITVAVQECMGDRYSVSLDIDRVEKKKAKK